jgi:hypothetical protein
MIAMFLLEFIRQHWPQRLGVLGEIVPYRVHELHYDVHTREIDPSVAE